MDQPATTAPASAEVSEYAEINARAAASYRRRRIRDRMLRIGLGAGVPIVLILLWQVASVTESIDARFFPAPSTIASRAYDDMAHGDLLSELWVNLRASLFRIGAGLFFGVTIGTVVGTLMGSVRFIRYSLAPLVYALYPMPKLAVLPLLLIIFGIGDVSKILLVSLGVFFVVALSAFSGTLYSPAIYHDVANAFGFPRLMRYRKVVLPAALPSIMSGIKLGIGQALILVVSVEFVSSNDGIGAFIWESWQTLDIPQMFIGLLCITILGAAGVLLGDALEHRLLPWAKR